MSTSKKDPRGEQAKEFFRKPPVHHGLPLSPSKQIEVTVPEDLSVILTPKAFSQLFGYTFATELEVSLLGIVDRKGSVFSIREFFLVEQTGSSARTEMDPNAVGELVERLIAEGRLEDAKKIRCWAHSHPGMDVFWSHTDDATCRLLAADWLVSVVVSDGFKIRSRIDVAAPVPFTMDHVPTFYESPVDQAVADQCAVEVKDKIHPMPLFSLGRIDNQGKERTVERAKRDGVELIEYCEECGGWHQDGQCPLRFESGYELARSERTLAAEDDVSGEDGVWF